MLIIPIKHEGMWATRWPIITFAFIAINTLVLLFTSNTQLEQRTAELSTVRAHIRLLAAMHPQLTVSAEVRPVIDKFREANPHLWEKMHDGTIDVMDGWDARMRLAVEEGPLQEEMDSLAAQYKQLVSATEEEGYAFIPAHPKPISYLTANFMHGGWLHLIGNMWFLWLAGFVLEDSWGRILYPIFYLVCGAAALQIFAWTEPGSLTPVLGASGAIAGLMGAFLVRFPKMRIHMRWFIGLRSLARGGYQFQAPAYAMLPLWLLTEVFYGKLSGSSDGVAHWAHVGGFAFGAVVSFFIRVSGLEHKATAGVEAKTSWTNEAEITQATELLDKGQLDEAEKVLQPYLAAKPDSFDAANLLQQVYWRKGNIDAYHELTMKVCTLHVKNREHEAAWQNYQEFLNSGGAKPPLPVWFDLCRAAEALHNYEGALKEYQKLISAHPTERQALMAQIAVGRIYQRINQPDQAIKFYEKAAGSTIPHLDLEPTIEAGIREAKRALAAPIR
ncbi:MAG TPA: rhomboid family intramembrane serine protease [Candidatus Angelobacter sp.]|nr:rhomboid family intramembrane serine protease [Candidatus Angelobacter sp.]